VLWWYQVMVTVTKFGIVPFTVDRVAKSKSASAERHEPGLTLK
jgi:hypothetical protein